MPQLRDFEYESLQDRETITKYMAAICEGFEKGSLVFNTDGEEMTLEPDGLIKMTLKATNKGGRMKLSLKFSWSTEKSKVPLKKEMTIK